MKNRLSRRVGWRAAALIFLFAGPLVKAGPVIRIATGESEPDSQAWQAFAKYLNDNLGEICTIEFVARDPEQALYDLAHPNEPTAVQGAILPPFRYVVGDLWIENLSLIARMRRGGVVSSVQAPVYAKPLSHYRSVVLMGRNSSDRWPPRDSQHPIGVSISDYRSTSEYVFPFAYFSEKGWLRFVSASPRNPSVQLPKDAWQIPQTRPETVPSMQSDYQLQFTKVKDHLAKVPILSVSDHRLNSFVPSEEEREKSYRELFRSAFIPFDAFVLRSDAADAETMRAISRAFLSTRDMSEQRRTDCFKWELKTKDLSATGPSPMPAPVPKASPGQYWQRRPDVHDFVEARDEDYDGVRSMAAKAFEGRVVEVGISPRVHRDEDNDSAYFRRWMKEVLTKTVSQKPVFLHIRAYDSDFDLLLADLEAGRLHAAELNAATAARAVGRQRTALIGRASFDNSGSYSFVMLVAKGGATEPNKIDANLRFAYTTEESSSGYQYPVTLLKKLGINPARNSWIKGDTAAGVVNLLLNQAEGKEPAADYGFVSSFEWQEIKRDWNDSELKNISTVAFDPEQTGTIPNAYLVFSRVGAPGIDVLGLPAINQTSALSWMKPVAGATPPPPDRDTIDAIRKHLRLEQNPTGFQGYTRVAPSDVADLADFYGRFGHDRVRPGIYMLIAVVLFLVAGVVFGFKRRDKAPQAPFTIQSVIDLLKGVPPQDAKAKLAVTSAVKQLAAFEQDPVLFGRILTPEGLRDLQIRLQDALLGLLMMHTSKRRAVDDGTYSMALGTLQAVTAAATEQLRPVPDAIARLNEPEQRVANVLDDVNTFGKIVRSIVDFLRSIFGG